MSKLIGLALTIGILATLAIAEPNEPETTEVQQGSTVVLDAENQQAEPRQLETYNLLHDKIIALEKHIQQTKEEIDKTFDYQMQCNEKAISSINASISGASYALMIFGIIVAIVGTIVTLIGIGLGIYIARQVRNVTHIAEQSKTTLNNHLRIRDEARELHGNIKNNMKQVYSDLKREETIALVDRLCEVPRDISNLASILASRTIPKELFSRMKRAYQSLSGDATASEAKVHYQLLFFQHFFSIAMFDEELQNEMADSYPESMQYCFKNDIIRTSEEFVEAIIKKGDLLDFTDKIKSYFIALKKNSPFANCSELHKPLYNILATKENRFGLYSILQLEAQLKDIAIIYGKFLLTNYKKVGNTEAEDKTLIAITEAIETKKNNSKPEPQK